MRSPTDYDLVARHLAGDTKALPEIMRRYTAPLRSKLRKALRWLENEDDVSCVLDDILQETWIRLDRHAARLDPTRKFSTWLFTVAINLSRNEMRNRKRRAVRLPHYGERLDVDMHVLSPVEPDVEDMRHCDQPDRLCEARDTWARLTAYLKENAPPEYHLTLELCAQGYTYEGMAEELNIPVGTVKSHLFRIRALSRRWIEKNG